MNRMELVFTNYRKRRIVLSDGAYEHIQEVHAEITLDQVKTTLEDPDEVRLSSYTETSELYYLRRTKQRYTCVVVKVCADGDFISTALTTAKPKEGRVIYTKGI